MSRSSATWSRGPSRKREGERAKRGTDFTGLFRRKRKRKKRKTESRKKGRRPGAFVPTAPDEARVALLFGRETLDDVRMKTLLSPLAAVLHRVFSACEREGLELRLVRRQLEDPCLPRCSNSLAMQFLASRWNLHCLGSTTDGYSCASGS